MTPTQIRFAITEPDAPRYNWSGALKTQIYSRQDGKCWVCGNRIGAICHIIHRGMGGDPRANAPFNLIGLCNYDHDRLDGRASPELRITYYDPEDSDYGLAMETKTDIGWRELGKDELAFYERP